MIILLLIFSATENDYSDVLANQLDGQREVRLWDDTRVDILTDEYAIEVDWAYKWAEAIGQSLYYGIVTGKKPMIIILIKDNTKDKKYIYRCQTICTKYGIKLKSYKIQELIP